MTWQDIAIRAGKTFLQAFIAVLLAANITSLGDLGLPLLDAAFVAGLSAAVSGLQNTFLSN
jgi:hypothetical protein